jgi:hypothetical protein
MSDGRMHDRFVSGVAAEDDVADFLEALGWTVHPFGEGLWHTRARRGPWRNAPDKLIHRDGDVRLVEVVTTDGRPTRPFELSKLAAMDAWSGLGPVVAVDATHWTAWEHERFMWAHDLVKPHTAGSGENFCTYLPDLPREQELGRLLR